MREDMHRTDLGYALSGVLGLGIAAVGTRFLASPAKAAAAYGISVGPEVSGADPYLSVKGVRHVASGLMTYVLIAAREPRVLAGFLLAATVIPVGDAVIVRRRGRSEVNCLRLARNHRRRDGRHRCDPARRISSFMPAVPCAITTLIGLSLLPVSSSARHA
jgi:Domain of unknown function (DUF4267)